jgi:putative ATP-dependent endonuclease of the OLD family
MHIRELKLWNFRKFGNSEWDLNNPHLVSRFSKGLNVLIGENDSGKSAIIDAIKLVLKTHAYEWIKIEDKDFFQDSVKLRIELIFDGIKPEEAKNFIEWLGWENDGQKNIPILRLIYQVEKKGKRILPADVQAGMDETGFPLNAEAKEYLKTTYLKALRDADNELIAKKNSRLSQIFQGHNLFKETDETKHEFTEWFKELNSKLKGWFESTDVQQDGKNNKAQIKDIIDGFLKEFIDGEVSSVLEATDPELKAILEKLSLTIEGHTNLGLGTLNRLYMAAELLHLKKDWDGLKLCLIEELEAHLHPQAQMKIVEVLGKETDVQFILTTHSPNLASKVPIENLILCNKDGAYSLAKGNTNLADKNYVFLKRFLDVTKSNLFFAKGVIIVEGWAEEILIPAIAQKLGYDLTKHEVSIVNVGSTAYLHFAKIFLRADGNPMKTPISIVTDLDVRPKKDGTFDNVQQKIKEARIKAGLGDLSNTNVQLHIAHEWTLEWCLYKSNILTELFKKSASKVHSKTKSFKKQEGEWNGNFETALISKLTKDKSSLDKVAVANELAELITNSDIDFTTGDRYTRYLIDAIKHTCRITNDN